MSKPLIFNRDRSSLIYSDNWIAVQVDGKCFTGVFLTEKDRMMLAAALIKSVERKK